MQAIFDAYLQHRKVTTDSRSCGPGTLFFALRGPSFNGNDFALDALAQGCALAVVDAPSLKGVAGCIWVPDVLTALQELATWYRRQSGVQVVGITGSNGKTTTKELLAQVLARKYRVWFTQGNLNNHIGVPLTLLAMPPDTEVAVVEMGANHVGEIAALCQIAQPDCGLITNVGKAHLEGFGSFEGVKQAKGELYAFLNEGLRPIFVNAGNPHLKAMLGVHYNRALKYGEGEDSLLRVSAVTAEPFLHFSWQMEGACGLQRVASQLSGRYNLENALAAIMVGLHFKVPFEEINAALESYTPANHRSQVVNTGHNQVLLDAYNANPSSMAAALAHFAGLDHPRKQVVLGGMKELGQDSLAEHLKLLAQLQDLALTACWLVGPEFKDLLPEEEGWLWFADAAAVAAYLREHPIKDALVLVKGSRANRLETLMEGL